MTGGQPEDDAWGIPGVAMPQPPVGEPAGHSLGFGAFDDQEAADREDADQAVDDQAADDQEPESSAGGAEADRGAVIGGPGASAPGGVAKPGFGRPGITRSEATAHDPAAAGQARTGPPPASIPVAQTPPAQTPPAPNSAAPNSRTTSGEALPPPAGEPIIAMLPTVDETPTTLMGAIRIDPADDAATQLIPVQKPGPIERPTRAARAAYGSAAAAQRPQSAPGGFVQPTHGAFAQPGSGGFVQPGSGGFAQPTHGQPAKPPAPEAAPVPVRPPGQGGTAIPLAHSAEATQLVQVAFQVPAGSPGGPRRPVPDPPTLREDLHPPKRRRTALISTLAAVAVVGVATAVITLNQGGSSQPSTKLGDPTSRTGQPGQPFASGSAGAAGAAPGLAVASSSGATPGASSGSPSGATSPETSRNGAVVAGPASSAPAKSLASSLLLRWRLADDSGTTAADSGPRGESGKLSGPVKFSTAHGGSAVFNPVSGQIKGAAITGSRSLDTTKSFTVSMWVNQATPTTPTKYACPFTQDGANYSAFFFTYSTAQQKWFFGRSLSATTNSGTDESWAYSTTPLNTWVLLTGVYDATAGTVTLYLNGAAQAPVHTRTAPYAVTGPLALGRSWYQTYPSNPYAGSISDFRVYNRVLTAAEVKSLLSAG